MRLVFSPVLPQVARTPQLTRPHAPHRRASPAAAPSPLYPSLPVPAADTPSSALSTPARASAASSAYGTPLGAPVATARGAPALAKTPLFRASTPDSTDSEDEEAAQPQVGVDSGDEDAGGPAAGDGEEEEDDSADELAAQLQRKAVLSPPASASKGKGKGKASSASASAAAPTPVTDDPHAPAVRRPPPPAAPSGAPEPLLSVGASLHLYDRSTGLFMQQDGAVTAGLYRVPAPAGAGAGAGKGSAGGAQWLVVESVADKGEVWVSQAVGKDTTVNFAEKERAMVFNYVAPAAAGAASEAGEVYTWLLRLASDDEFAALQQAVSAALFEDKHGAGAWNRMKDDERDYARRAWLEEDVEMWDVEEEEEEEREDAREEEERRERDEEGEEDSEEDEPRPASDDDDDDSGASVPPFSACSVGHSRPP